MAIKLNWKSVYAARDHLRDEREVQDDTTLTFVLLFKDGTQRQKAVKFKDFLRFLWFIYDSNKFYATGLVVKDSTGNVLYRHKQSTCETEEIPNGGNPHIIPRWSTLNEEQKEAHLKILLSQIAQYADNNESA